jgi:signal transduction histidine kinase
MRRLQNLLRAREIFPARNLSVRCFALPLLLFVLGAAEHKACSSEVITNIARIWSFPEELRSNANPVKLTVTVNYYDPRWGLLWVQEGEHGLFCAPKPPFPAIRAGQQVEISAFTRRGTRDVSLSNAQYRVLSETGLPAPWRISGPLSPSGGRDNIRCRIEGYVRRIQGGDSSHVRFEVVAGEMIVRAILSVTDRSEWNVPEDSFVRVTGVFTPKFDRNGKLLDAQMAIPRIEDVELLQTLSANAGFDVPVRTIASLQTSPSNELVRVQGKIERREPGASVIIQDGSGRVTVETWQTRAAKPGDLVEGVGLPVADGPALRLRQGMFRPIDRVEIIAHKAEATNGTQELFLTSEVRQLSPEEAAKGYPVRIVGVITWSDPESDKLFLQDSSGGIGVVKGPKSFPHVPRAGDWLEVRGITGDGGYSPVILNPDLAGRGNLKIPDARLLSLEQALTGEEDSQWVEMRGYVRSVSDAPGLARLDIATSSGSFIARVRTSSRLRELRGAIVRLRGVCSALSNDRRQLTGVQLWVSGTDAITVEEEAPQDPFSVPLRTIASLGQFSTSATLNRRTKLQGVVTLNAGRYFYVQEGMDGLLVLTEQPSGIQRGDRVEAVGFPGREGRHRVLRDAVFRKISADAEPAPLKIDSAATLDEDLDGRLVVAEGTILQQTRAASGLQFTLRDKERIFEARFESDPGQLQDLASGSRVALTGVYRIHYNESQAPQFFQLYLRSPTDIQVLRRPSWWTPRRTVFVLTIGSVLLSAGLAWTLIINRKNQVLEEQIRERRNAEVKLQRVHAELEQRVRDRTVELSRANEELKNEIAERERAEERVERANKELMETAHQAGMAEVATSVLHNVGNVLNSLNVSATLVAEGLKDSKVTKLTRLADLIHEHRGDLGLFFAQDSRGKQIPEYFLQLAGHLIEQRAALLKEIHSLTDNVDHIKQIVVMQQSYAKVSGVDETLAPADLIEHALLMHAGAMVRHEIKVLRDYEKVPPVSVDKHKVLQILINVISNAKYAMDANEPGQRVLRVQLRSEGSERVSISVIDNGVGIAKENLDRIFQHGFTTKKNGHGFGLHSSAIAARQLGGSLRACSEGEGRGATFLLELPVAEMEQTFPELRGVDTEACVSTLDS